MLTARSAMAKSTLLVLNWPNESNLVKETSKVNEELGINFYTRKINECRQLCSRVTAIDYKSSQLYKASQKSPEKKINTSMWSRLQTPESRLLSVNLHFCNDLCICSRWRHRYTRKPHGDYLKIPNAIYYAPEFFKIWILSEYLQLLAIYCYWRKLYTKFLIKQRA